MRKSISLKIFSIALVLLVLMGVVTGISAIYLDDVSDEAIELAHYYVPIAEKTQAAARHASAELLHFERYVSLNHVGADAARLQAEVTAMRSRGALVDRMVTESLALVARGIADREINIASPNFIRLQAELPQISRSHRDMRAALEDYVKQSAVDSAGTPAVLVLERELTRLRDGVGKEIEDVTYLLQKLTEDSANTALALELRAAQLTRSVALAAALFGLLLAAWITRTLVRPVRELVVGTQAVRSGNLDVNVQVGTSDEIATLADSFNHMIGGLKQKEAIQSTFGRYVDPRIVKNLLENEELAQVGIRQVMTVFFTGIEGFTTLCEALPPEAVVKFLNHYFNAMSQPVRETHGIIDKYIGDSIMAFWGPPFVGAEDHAILACKAAIAQCERGARLADSMRVALGADLPAMARIDTRVGITTGEVTVGSVGSEHLKGYTVVGDTVNLASRLESANKQYGSRIIISEDTWAAARGEIATRELDCIRVVGKQRPVRIFEVLGLRVAADVASAEFVGQFEAALAEIRLGNMAGARIGFQAVLEIRPDQASRLFLDRIALVERDGLPEHWDGVWSLTHK